MTDPRHNYVCSYCGQSASFDGRCGDGAYLTCGHESTGDWDRGTYKDGAGSPIPQGNFDPSKRIAELNEELRRLNGGYSGSGRD